MREECSYILVLLENTNEYNHYAKTRKLLSCNLRFKSFLIVSIPVDPDVVR